MKLILNVYVVLPAAGLPARYQPGQLYNWKSRWAVIFLSQKKKNNRRGLIANGPMNIRFPRTDALGAKKGKALDKPVKVLSSLQKRICAYWDFSFISHVNTAAIRNTRVVKSESKAFLQCLDLISSKAALYKNIFFSFMWFYFPDLCILTEGRKQSITGFRTNIA